jgi:hypothetical protein
MSMATETVPRPGDAGSSSPLTPSLWLCQTGTSRTGMNCSSSRVCRCMLLVLSIVLAACSSTTLSAGDAEFDQVVRPFLTQYCSECHGAREQQGDRRFDILNGQIGDSNALADYQDILDQLNLSEMPPAEAMQPSGLQRLEVVDWLTRQIRNYHTAAQRPVAVLRRLNAREYRNTIRDLFGINVAMFHPDSAFPRDQVTHQLDNVGDALVTSGFLLARYLDAADAVVTKAMEPVQRPQEQTWIFRDRFRQQPEIDQVHGKTNNFSHITLYDVTGADKPEGAYGPLLAFREGVPQDGYYTIRLRAEAVNRQHPYDPEFLGTDPSEPLKLGIVAGNARVGPLHKTQPIEPQLAAFDLADQPEWYTARVWLDRGWTPRFTFINGLMDVRGIWGRLLKKYPDQFPKERRSGIVGDRFNAIRYGKLPQIHIHEVQITGPTYESWPTPRQRMLLGDDWEAIAAGSKLDESVLRAHFRRIASQAYRRPVEDSDVEQVMQVCQKRLAAGGSQLQAFGDGVRMILCSPHFLYLEPAAEGRLSDWALASRLSYFLWSALPDTELRNAASAGNLSDPEVLARHVDRMLDDPRSDAFVQGFLDSWLGFRDLGSMPPDRSKFRSFYHYDLGTAMRQETEHFIRHLIDANLSVANCLDSEFTFVNRPLARFYGIDVPQGDGFEKVTIADSRRGGLLGQASVLTVTANGIDTSPVVRGVWLLENILGDPPPAPPPDVEPLDPDVRGATSIRDQLQKHRTVASCNSCHRSIDPMGFALENFDPVGRWRDRYSRRVAIDASGELPDGQTYQDITEFKSILMQRKEQFTRALATRMLAYATGRMMTAVDRPHIDHIVEQLAERGDGYRDLIQLITSSEPFLAP